MLAHRRLATVHRRRDIAIGNFLDRVHQDCPSLVLRQKSYGAPHVGFLLRTGDVLGGGPCGIGNVFRDNTRLQPLSLTQFTPEGVVR